MVVGGRVCLSLLAIFCLMGGVLGQLQDWHRSCSLVKDLQLPLSKLVVYNFKELSTFFFENKDPRFAGDAPKFMIEIYVTGIAFRKETNLQAIATLQLKARTRENPILYFFVVLENCQLIKKKGEKDSFTFELNKSFVPELNGSRTFVEEAAFKFSEDKTKWPNTGGEVSKLKTEAQRTRREIAKGTLKFLTFPLWIIPWFMSCGRLFDTNIEYNCFTKGKNKTLKMDNIEEVGSVYKIIGTVTHDTQ